jgi:6-pyruvoyl-tetrahydropterin synthase
MTTRISYEASFTAEHQAPGHEPHVHVFRLVVSVEGPLVDGVVMDFAELQVAVGAAVVNLLRCIEAVPPLEALPEGSSVEQMAVWIWGELARGLSNLAEVRIHDGAFAVTYWGPA